MIVPLSMARMRFAFRVFDKHRKKVPSRQFFFSVKILNEIWIAPLKIKE